MEIDMERIIKEKEKVVKISIIPLEVVPLTSIPTSTSSIENTQNTANQLESVVGNMSLPIEEIQRLPTQVNILQD